jgi:rfaE bifunctional protein nucleotidyltransferase chain/domain
MGKRELEAPLLNKIVNIEQVSALVEQWKAAGEKIVFTNGVFDLLHIGHVSYLTKAAELGDRLIIGLNADSSVKRLKGENRPVNNQLSRSVILASMFFVDAIVLFEEDTPLKLISLLLPDILVKGADYQIEKIVGAKEVLANGGDVQTIDFVDGHSSSAIIDRIKKQV